MRWWESVLATLAPRLILDSKIAEGRSPGRIYSDATGRLDLRSLSFTSPDERPLALPLQGEAEEALHPLAANANEIYISKLFAEVAEVCEPRGELSGREIILFVRNEAASAAVTKRRHKGPASFDSSVHLVVGRAPMRLGFLHRMSLFRAEPGG